MAESVVVGRWIASPLHVCVCVKVSNGYLCGYLVEYPEQSVIQPLGRSCGSIERK